MRRSAVAAAALAFASPAGAAVNGFPHEFRVGETRTVTILVWRQPGYDAINWIETTPPPGQQQLSVTADDPAWQGARRGSVIRWSGPTLPVGERLALRMRLHFETAGGFAALVRVNHGPDLTDESGVGVDVAGSTSGIGGDVTLVLLAGAAIFLGFVVVFVAGRKRLQG